MPRSLAYTENILQFLLICCLDFAGTSTWMGKFTEPQLTISKTACGSLSFATFTSIINFDDKIKDSFTRGRLLPIVFFKTTADIIEVSIASKQRTQHNNRLFNILSKMKTPVPMILESFIIINQDRPPTTKHITITYTDTHFSRDQDKTSYNMYCIYF